MIWFLFSCQPKNSDSGILVPPASYTLEEYQNQIQDTLTFGVPNAEEARLAYLSWMQNGDNNCPGSDYLLQGIIEPCTSNSGHVFSGLVSFMGSTNTLSFPDSYEVGADCYILSPNEERFIGAGELTYDSTGDGSNGAIESTIKGTWQSPIHEEWLTRDNSIWMSSSLTWEGDDWSISLNGAYHLDDTSLRFQNLFGGSDCTAGMGSIELRDPTGYWLKIALDSACDGCGQATYQGEEQGEICLDLSSTFQNEYQQLRVNE